MFSSPLLLTQRRHTPTQALDEADDAGLTPAHGSSVHGAERGYGIQVGSKTRQKHPSSEILQRLFLVCPWALSSLASGPWWADPQPVCVKVVFVSPRGSLSLSFSVALCYGSPQPCDQLVPSDSEGQAGIFSWGTAQWRSLTCYSGIVLGLYLSRGTHYTGSSALPFHQPRCSWSISTEQQSVNTTLYHAQTERPYCHMGHFVQYSFKGFPYLFGGTFPNFNQVDCSTKGCPCRAYTNRVESVKPRGCCLELNIIQNNVFSDHLTIQKLLDTL